MDTWGRGQPLVPLLGMRPCLQPLPEVATAVGREPMSGKTGAAGSFASRTILGTSLQALQLIGTVMIPACHCACTEDWRGTWLQANVQRSHYVSDPPPLVSACCHSQQNLCSFAVFIFSSFHLIPAHLISIKLHDSSAIKLQATKLGHDG